MNKQKALERILEITHVETFLSELNWVRRVEIIGNVYENPGLVQ